MDCWLKLIFISCALELAVGHEQYKPKKRAGLEDNNSSSSSSSSSESKESQGNDKTKSSKHNNNVRGSRTPTHIFQSLLLTNSWPPIGQKRINNAQREAAKFAQHSNPKGNNNEPEPNIFPGFKPIPYWGKRGSPKMNSVPQTLLEPSRKDIDASSTKDDSSSESDESEESGGNKNPKQSKKEFVQRPFGRRVVPRLGRPIPNWSKRGSPLISDEPQNFSKPTQNSEENINDDKSSFSNESDSTSENSSENNNPKPSKKKFLPSPSGRQANDKPMPSFQPVPNWGGGGSPQKNSQFQRFFPQYTPTVRISNFKPIPNWSDRGSPELNKTPKKIGRAPQNPKRSRNGNGQFDNEVSSSEEDSGANDEAAGLPQRSQNGVSGSRLSQRGPIPLPGFIPGPIRLPIVGLPPNYGQIIPEGSRNDEDLSDSENISNRSGNSEGSENKDDKLGDSDGNGEPLNPKRRNNGGDGSRFGQIVRSSFKPVPIWGVTPQMNGVPKNVHKSARNSERRQPSDSVGTNGSGSNELGERDPVNPIKVVPKPVIYRNDDDSYGRESPTNSEKKKFNVNDEPSIVFLTHAPGFVPNWGDEGFRAWVHLLVQHAPPKSKQQSQNVLPPARIKKSSAGKSEFGRTDGHEIPSKSAKTASRMHEPSLRHKKHRHGVHKKHREGRN